MAEHAIGPVSGNDSPRAAGLRALFERLKLGYVKEFGDSNSGDPLMPEPRSRLTDANIVTSRYPDQQRHAVLLDIDHPAWLVKSSRPNHFHLYIDVPGGIPEDVYIDLLKALADAGVIEQGYYRTSKFRGFTSLRLPWIKKGQTS